jgi:hypothetical protein
MTSSSTSPDAGYCFVPSVAISAHENLAHLAKHRESGEALPGATIAEQPFTVANIPVSFWSRAPQHLAGYNPGVARVFWLQPEAPTTPWNSCRTDPASSAGRA